MPKEFYTERDIEDMAARGQYLLTVGENVVLTELAYEKANRLGVKLVQPNQTPPASPVRPYLSEPVKAPARHEVVSAPQNARDEDLRERIRNAVKAKLGDQIDPQLLETIITRVLNNVGIE